jgi:adenosine deaminase
MSRTTLTDEYEVAHRSFGLSRDDLEVMTLNALKSSFIDYTQRVELIRQVIDASEGRLGGQDRPGSQKP